MQEKFNITIEFTPNNSPEYDEYSYKLVKFVKKCGGEWIEIDTFMDDFGDN